MAVTPDSFIRQYSEFARTDVDLIQAKLDSLEIEIDALEWGVLRDKAISLRLAHELALSPHGERARRVGSGTNLNRGFPDETSTFYMDEYLRLRKRVIFAVTLSGGHD